MMVNFIKSEQDYVDATNELNKVFLKEKDIVQNSFRKEFKIFRGFEFDKIYSERFYISLQHFLKKKNSKGFTFYTLIPQSDNYFFPHFTKHSIARIAMDATFEEYIEFLHRDPGNSPADALLHNAETIALYSNEPIWGITGSKDLEIGIVGFKDEITKIQFTNCFDDDVFIDIRSRLDDINVIVKSQPETKTIHSKMIKNYLSRR